MIDIHYATMNDVIIFSYLNYNSFFDSSSIIMWYVVDLYVLKTP